MYKTIIRLATLDGKAAITVLWANLHNCMQYAVNKNGNIDSIHTYFNYNYAQLKACGQSVNGNHTILFEAYLQGVPNATFHDYMRRLQNDQTDEMEDTRDSIHEDIMKKAKAKCQNSRPREDHCTQGSSL
jgi:hypothetical protein